MKDANDVKRAQRSTHANNHASLQNQTRGLGEQVKSSTHSIHSRVQAVSHQVTAQELVTANISEKIDVLLYNQAKQDKKIDEIAAMQLRQDQMLSTCAQLLRTIAHTLSPDDNIEEHLSLDSAKKLFDDLFPSWSEYPNEGLEMPNFPDRDNMKLIHLAEVLRGSIGRETVPPTVMNLKNQPIYMKLNSRFAPNGVLQQSLDMDPCDKLRAFGENWVDLMKDSDKHRKFPNVMLPHATNDKLWFIC